MIAINRSRTLVLLAAVTLGIVLIVTPRANAQSVPDVTVHIEITSSGFVPQVTEIEPGWAVQWTNNDDVNHVVASSDDDADFIFDTGLLPPGESGAFVFDMEGTFEYFSVTNPEFTGTVIVGGTAVETPAAPTATATNPPAATATPAPANTSTPAPTTPANSPTAAPTEPTPELPSTQEPSGTATPEPTATAEATAAPAQPTPPPPSAGGAGLNAIGGTSPGMAGILLGLAAMALAGASLLYSGSLGRIGIESPRNRRK